MQKQLTHPSRLGRPAHSRIALLLLVLLGTLSGGCATIRVTDPPRTATEQFLLTNAAQRAIEQLSMDGLRDQYVYVDSTYFTQGQNPAAQDLYLLGELRARLLREGVRVTGNRQVATVIVEVRSGGLGIDRLEYLLGIPQIALSGTGLAGGGSPAGGVPVLTPELAIVKSTKQRGFASVAIVAFRADTGALIAMSGPFIGRTVRDDYWFFGAGPRTLGNIPPAE